MRCSDKPSVLQSNVRSVLQDQIGCTGSVMPGYGLLESVVHAKFANESEHQRDKSPNYCPCRNAHTPSSECCRSGISYDYKGGSGRVLNGSCFGRLLDADLAEDERLQGRSNGHK